MNAELEDKLREAMLAASVKENRRARKQWGGGTIEKVAVAKENGAKGGNPKRIKLTEKAKVVNRMLKRHMTIRDIGDVLGVSHQSVSDMKKRYALPRSEE
jgi:DNA-directed RNA polymerase specialized sigma subunit